MAKSGSSKRWLQRHVSDPYVRGAQQQGYRSRAAYKLLEIDAKDRLLAPGQVVVELGAAPGSWAQVIAGRVQLEPGLAIYNLLNSSAVTQEANIATGGLAGSFSLGRPLSTVQGRFLRLETMVKF